MTEECIRDMLANNALPALAETLPFLESAYAQIDTLELYVRKVQENLDALDAMTQEEEDKHSKLASLKKLVPSFLKVCVVQKKTRSEIALLSSSMSVCPYVYG